jgi:hypothetical protein
MQTSLNLAPKLSPQCQKLYNRLLQGGITNVEMRDELRLLCYTKRLSELRRILPNENQIETKRLGNGIFEYSIKGN